MVQVGELAAPQVGSEKENQMTCCDRTVRKACYPFETPALLGSDEPDEGIDCVRKPDILLTSYKDNE